MIRPLIRTNKFVRATRVSRKRSQFDADFLLYSAAGETSICGVELT